MRLSRDGLHQEIAVEPAYSVGECHHVGAHHQLRQLTTVMNVAQSTRPMTTPSVYTATATATDSICALQFTSVPSLQNYYSPYA